MRVRIIIFLIVQWYNGKLEELGERKHPPSRSGKIPTIARIP